MDECLRAEWFDPLFRAEAMRRVFSDRGRLQGILDLEAALARGLARAGVMPASAADAIRSQCRAELFDIGELSQATALAGNSAIPIVQELARRVSKNDHEAARFVHWAATSQDAMDSGLVLQVRDAFDLLEADIVELGKTLVNLASKHKETPMVGRTWMQQAAATTFGLKATGWLSALVRHLERIRQTRSRCLMLQLGGAVGTLAALGDQAENVVIFVAEELRLAVPELPWHSQRDRMAEIAAVLGLVVGTLGKIAHDIALMAQTEIAEVAEPAAPGRGGSSSMPQKQNPVGCAVALAAATRVPALVNVMFAAMPQEHERGLGGWQAEWETLPEIFRLASGALAQIRVVMEGLVVHPFRMRANIEATRGLIYAESVSGALASRIGRSAAHALVEHACQRALADGKNLQDVVVDDPEIASHLSGMEQRRLFDLQPHVSAAARLVERAIERADRALSCSRSK